MKEETKVLENAENNIQKKEVKTEEEKKIEGGKTQIEELEEQEQKEKKSEKRRTGILHIISTKNNTILMLADMAGNTISRASGGQSTKQARLKSSPTVAMFSAKKIAEDAKEHGITDLYVRIRGETGGTSSSSAAHAVIKTLSRDDFKIVSLMELTKMPRGGPKKAGGRRGRRV